MEKKENKILFWRNSFIFGVVIYVLLGIYMVMFFGRFSLSIANKLSANTAMVLIGLSFALSGIGYFFHFNKYFRYRKYIGVIGFYYILTHGLISLFFLPKIFPFPAYYLNERNLFPFIYALFSLLILLMMAIISNKRFSEKIEGKIWRRLLRTGYVAYVLGMMHFGLKKYNSWLSWFRDMNTLPPLNMLIFFFAILVIGLRLALFLSQRKKKHAQTF